MKLFILVQAVDLGDCVLGVYSNLENAYEALVNFRKQEELRLPGYKCGEKDFHLIESVLNGPASYLEWVR